MKGMLFVIEGTDASGKATQAELLKDRFVKKGFDSVIFSFPRYDTRTGRIVKQYLDGDFGSLEQVTPEFASLLYSLDKYAALKELEQALDSGKIVVCDRFTASNAAHQGAKFSDLKERKKFIEWISFTESRLPKPTATIFLDVPVSISQKLMKNRSSTDIHESNIQYLERVRSAYLMLAEKENWFKINCTENECILSREKIHSKIFDSIKRFL